MRAQEGILYTSEADGTKGLHPGSRKGFRLHLRLRGRRMESCTPLQSLSVVEVLRPGSPEVNPSTPGEVPGMTTEVALFNLN
jgi:hypothetical protein